MAVIVGIDPGAKTGVACFANGALRKMETISPHNLEHMLNVTEPLRVVFEDSRLNSFLWTPARQARTAALKIARNIGEIDAYCRLIEAWCEDRGIEVIRISPKEKGTKIGKAEFAKFTGWTQNSNQHERDAAMVAWPWRFTMRP